MGLGGAGNKFDIAVKTVKGWNLRYKALLRFELKLNYKLVIIIQ